MNCERLANKNNLRIKISPAGIKPKSQETAISKNFESTPAQTRRKFDFVVQAYFVPIDLRKLKHHTGSSQRNSGMKNTAECLFIEFI